MVAVSAASVNAIDIPEATLGAHRASRKNKHLVPKWSWELAEEHDEVSKSKPDLQAMFPLFESELVRLIVTESQTWEKALGILLALADDDIQFEHKQAPITKDPVTDHLGFPTLLSSDGWEVVRGVDLDEKHHSAWCGDTVRDANQNTESTCGLRLWDKDDRQSSMVLQDQRVKVVAVAADYDHLEVETEHECRQRRGTERRLNHAKHNRRPTAFSVPSTFKQPSGQLDKEHRPNTRRHCSWTCQTGRSRHSPLCAAGPVAAGVKNSEPPGWRLCRFEDRL